MKLAIVVLALVAAVYAQGGGGGGGHHHEHHGHATSYINGGLVVKHEKEVHLKAHPHFHYDYAVHDDKHHDYKSKHEARDGYHVKGSYRFLQPDHLVRQVDYESDKKQGWVAKVTYHKHH